MKEHRLSIWFIIGVQLVVMGIIIIWASVLSIYSPPAHPVIFEELHPGLYEGVVLLVLGIFYTVRFRPR